MRQPPQREQTHYPPVPQRLLDMDLYLTGIGTNSYRPGETYPRRVHPERYFFTPEAGRVLKEFALVRILEGRGVFESQGMGKRQLSAGMIVVLVPGRWHRYAPNATTGWTEQWICLNGPYLHRIQRNRILPDGACLIENLPPAAWDGPFSSLLAELNLRPGENSPTWGLAGLALLMQALENAQPRSDSPEAAGTLHGRACNFIETNCHRPIGIRDVAANLGVTRRTLERHFQNFAQVTPAVYLQRTRLERARRLLRQTDLPIKAISYTCGFGSPQRMIYDFRRVWRMTPGQVRGEND